MICGMMFVLFFRRQACGALEGGQLVAREVYPPALAGAVELEDVIGLAVDEAVVALAELIGLIAPLIARLLLVPALQADPLIDPPDAAQRSAREGVLPVQIGQIQVLIVEKQPENRVKMRVHLHGLFAGPALPALLLIEKGQHVHLLRVGRHVQLVKNRGHGVLRPRKHALALLRLQHLPALSAAENAQHRPDEQAHAKRPEHPRRVAVRQTQLRRGMVCLQHRL